MKVHVIPLKPECVKDVEAMGIWLMGRFAEIGMDPKLDCTIAVTARLARTFSKGQLVVLRHHSPIPYQEFDPTQHPHGMMTVPDHCNSNLIEHWEVYVVDHADLSKLVP